MNVVTIMCFVHHWKNSDCHENINNYCIENEQRLNNDLAELMIAKKYAGILKMIETVLKYNDIKFLALMRIWQTKSM